MWIMTFLRIIPPIPLACFHHVLFDLNSANNQIDRSLSYGSVRFGSCDLSWENYQVPSKSDAKREREGKKTPKEKCNWRIDCNSCDFCTYIEQIKENGVCTETQRGNICIGTSKYVEISFFLALPPLFFFSPPQCNDVILYRERKKMIDFNEQFLFVFLK